MRFLHMHLLDKSSDQQEYVQNLKARMGLKVAFAQDLSGSFGDDIDTVRKLVPDIVSGAKLIDSTAEIAVTSFVDKPMYPFGSSFGDYVYKTDLSVTNDQSKIQDIYDNLVIKDGNDGDEAQLESLLQISQRDEDLGWADSDDKVVILFTDAGFHQEGDNPGTPNNYDSVLDGTPEGTGEDYPAVAELGFLYRQKSITPIFAVTEYVFSAYEDLIKAMGAGGGVVELSSDSSNIVDAVKSALVKSSGLEYLAPSSGISFREDETYELKIRLKQKPDSNVTFSGQVSDTTKAVITEGSMTFTPENWDVYQVLEINGIDNDDLEINRKYTVDFSVFTSSDVAFNSYKPASIFFTLTDDDLSKVEKGATLTATSAASVELAENATFLPSEESDTAKFAKDAKSSVKATPKEIRDDIFYDFNKNSELEIKIDSEVVGAIEESDLSSYFKISEGSAVVQFDTNFDGDFVDVTDTVFTFKGSYDLEKFSFVKSSDGVQVLYNGDINGDERGGGASGGGGGGSSSSSSSSTSSLTKPEEVKKMLVRVPGWSQYVPLSAEIVSNDPEIKATPLVFDSGLLPASQDVEITGSLLTGGDGDNTLYGLSGWDVIDAGAGNDRVRGGNGRDVITGGTGSDELWGDFGWNTFLANQDGSKDLLVIKSDQLLENWWYGKSGNSPNGEKADIITELDAFDQIKILGAETEQITIKSASAHGLSGLGIFAAGFLEAVYIGENLSAEQLSLMVSGDASSAVMINSQGFYGI